ncbi:hypothetical protein EVAR_80636_1 [Eumeta japonica]|uniref:Uncharacterized protein n=1 Tax=Eumeta variegata TaxID=151549 RepID=A0A4C1YQU3_EUMVA|nr:hypothetical protein EVAR_80636_1 [Eumeta japonica]
MKEQKFAKAKEELAEMQLAKSGAATALAQARLIRIEAKASSDKDEEDTSVDKSNYVEGCLNKIDQAAPSVVYFEETHLWTSQHWMPAITYISDIVDQLEYKNATPMLLIGQDNWALTVSNEVRIGPRHLPNASRVNLRWVLHGYRSSHTDKAMYFINHLQKEEGFRLSRVLFTLTGVALSLICIDLLHFLDSNHASPSFQEVRASHRTRFD